MLPGSTAVPEYRQWCAASPSCAGREQHEHAHEPDQARYQSVTAADVGGIQRPEEFAVCVMLERTQAGFRVTETVLRLPLMMQHSAPHTYLELHRQHCTPE